MQRINLDTSRKATNQNVRVYIRTGEKEFTTIGVSLTTYGIPYDLTGFTVNFEGANAEGRFSGGGAKIVNAANGQIEYTFTPTDAAVEGWFETAYFVIKKADEIEGTTEAFAVHVSRRVDIDDEQAEAGVNTLQETINAMEATFNEWKAAREADYAGLQSQADALATQITSAKADLDSKVAEAQTAVGTAKTDALNAIDEAITKLNAAIEEFNAADFYTKAEADTLIEAKLSKADFDSFNQISKVPIEPLTGFARYTEDGNSTNYPYAVKRSGIVTIKGAFTNLKDLSSTETGLSFSMGQLPVGYRPAENFNFVSQGLSMNKFLLTVTKEGQVIGARYGTGASSAPMPTGAWLYVGATFVAAEPPAP